jgi:hypothetical protein
MAQSEPRARAVRPEPRHCGAGRETQAWIPAPSLQIPSKLVEASQVVISGLALADIARMSVGQSASPKLTGTGTIKTNGNPSGMVSYTVHLAMSGQATLVELDPRPDATDGERLHLTLADGRFVTCQMLDDSAFCAVMGEGPFRERRKQPR